MSAYGVMHTMMAKCDLTTHPDEPVHPNDTHSGPVHFPFTQSGPLHCPFVTTGKPVGVDVTVVVLVLTPPVVVPLPGLTGCGAAGAPDGRFGATGPTPPGQTLLSHVVSQGQSPSL